MRTLLLPALLLFSCVTGLAGAADHPDPGEFPAATRWLVHLDVDTFLHSGLGGWLRTQVDEHPKRAQLDALIALARFDPFKDLRSLTLGGTTPDPDRAVLYLRGTFDAEHLVKMLRANEAYEARAHEGTVIHSWVDHGVRSFGCFARPDLILISRNLAAVGTCLDTLAGRAEGMTTTLGLDRDGSLVALATGVDELARRTPKAAALLRIRHLFLHLAEVDGAVTLTAGARAQDEEAALLLDQVVLGARAAALLNSGSLPPIVERLAASLTTARDGVTVSASLALPVEEVVALLEQQLARRQNADGGE